MFDRFLNFFLAALLLAFFLPLLAWYSIRATLDSRRSRPNRSELSEIGRLKRQIAAEFNFERAIEAYEELIDSTFAEGHR
ncbi:MAG: hypothetical protein WA802_17375 [Terracidiphilus sp.]